MTILLEQVRHMSLYLFHQKKSPIAATKEICSVYGDGVLTVKMCREWFRRFKSGNFDLTIAKNRNYKNIIRDVENNSMKWTSRNLSEKYKMSIPEVETILEEAQFVRIVDFWHRRILPEEEHGFRISSCFCSLQTLQKDRSIFDRMIVGNVFRVCYRKRIGRKRNYCGTLRTSDECGKLLLSFWWNAEGVIHREVVKPDRELSEDVYCRQLDILKDALKKEKGRKRAKSNTLFYMDTLTLFPCKEIDKKMKEYNWKQFYCNCNADVNPSYYHILKTVMDFLESESFSSNLEAERGILDFLDAKPVTFYERGIKSLEDRWNYICDNDGAYILDENVLKTEV